MKYAVDLHIHSALSPCSADDMTPNNIANMASIKGLDFIAITDHNSCENLEAVSKCAKTNGILLVPGMELETREEVHLICLFTDIAHALSMQELVYKALPKINNREDIFGRQLILDENDGIKGEVQQLLLTAANLGVDEAFSIVGSMGGAVIPAHIDRSSYSIISNLGMIPDTLNVGFVEISRECDGEEYKSKNPFLCAYQFIKSSDAHELGSMLERESFIELEEKSVECLINDLRIMRLKF
jgi:PHP family Zn ribbon phosphoesterase